MAEILWSKVLAKSFMPFLCLLVTQIVLDKEKHRKLVFSVLFGAANGI
jgi:hypothetical protein